MLAFLFVVLALAVRFLPHPLAFTPVVASLLFFGARGPRRQLWLPWLLLVASDVVLTKLYYVYPLTWDHTVTWAWYLAMLWLGTKLGNSAGPLPILGTALAGSVSFFLVSNFAVWGAWGDMYPRTWRGLMACYAAGVPFFRRALAGDLLFTAAMFATPAVLHRLGQAWRSAGDHPAAA